MKRVKRPPKEIISAVFDLLEERDVQLPQSHVEMTTAVLLHYLTNYFSGNEKLAEILGLKAFKASNDKNYLIQDPFSSLTEKVKPESIIFLQGCVVDGNPFPIDNVLVEDKESYSCDSCGTSVICEKEFREEFLCSNCLSNQEDPKARDLVDLECKDCDFTKCSWHPSKNENLFYSEMHYG